MRVNAFLALLSFVISACNLLPSSKLGIGIPVEYVASGVCAGVEITSNNGVVTGIAYDYSKEGKNDGVTFVSGQPVRIPEPKPQATTRYAMGTEPASGGQQLAVDVTWKCLTNKQPVSIRFMYTVGGSIEKGLKITENPASPNGFDVVVTDFPR